MRRLLAIGAVAASLPLSTLASIPASASTNVASKAASSMPSVVTCAHLSDNPRTGLFTVSRCNGGKGFTKATGSRSFFFSSYTGGSLTWKGGAITNLPVETGTIVSGYACQRPHVGTVNAIAISGVITAVICFSANRKSDVRIRLALGTVAVVQA